jgi:predicted TPR repeat methyltransferase
MSLLPAFRVTSGDLLADRRFAYGQACLEDGDWQGAQDLARQVLERVPDFSPAFLLLGRACLRLEQEGEAVEAFRDALRCDPSDPGGAGLELAWLLGEGAGFLKDQAISPAFVRHLFDAYAPVFETHLENRLGYRAPLLLKTLIDEYIQHFPLKWTPVERKSRRSAQAKMRKNKNLERRSESIRSKNALGQCHFARVLDLGCGTGLMGDIIRPFAAVLTGCDLSPAMLAKARAKAVYDQLYELDLLSALAGEENGWDAIFAADVLVYCGALAPVLAGVFKALKPGGIFAFSLQTCESRDFSLGPDSRYAHNLAYVERSLTEAGLAVVAVRAASTRCEGGGDVPGAIGLVEKPVERKNRRSAQAKMRQNTN